MLYRRSGIRPDLRPGRNAGPDDHSQVRDPAGDTAADAEEYGLSGAGRGLRHRRPPVPAADPSGRHLGSVLSKSRGRRRHRGAVPGDDGLELRPRGRPGPRLFGDRRGRGCSACAELILQLSGVYRGEHFKGCNHRALDQRPGGRERELSAAAVPRRSDRALGQPTQFQLRHGRPEPHRLRVDGPYALYRTSADRDPRPRRPRPAAQRRLPRGVVAPGRQQHPGRLRRARVELRPGGQHQHRPRVGVFQL